MLFRRRYTVAAHSAFPKLSFRPVLRCSRLDLSVSNRTLARTSLFPPFAPGDSRGQSVLASARFRLRGGLRACPSECPTLTQSKRLEKRKQGAREPTGARKIRGRKLGRGHTGVMRRRTSRPAASRSLVRERFGTPADEGGDIQVGIEPAAAVAPFLFGPVA